MSIKTLAGISAAAILSILAGNAYGELAEGLKATKSQGFDNTNAVSAILGGTALGYSGSAGAYVKVGNNDTNYATTLGGGGMYSGDQLVNPTSNWSILAVAKLKAGLENGAIYGIGRYNAGGSCHKGLALIQKDGGTVKLVHWAAVNGANNDTITTILDDVAVPYGDLQYHSYLVTHAYTAAVADPATPARSTYTLYIDGVEKKTATIDALEIDTNGYQMGNVHGAIPEGLNYGTGILLDEVGVWTSDVGQTGATALATELPVYPTIKVADVTITESVTWAELIAATPNADTINITVDGAQTLTFGGATTIGNIIVKGGELIIADNSNLTADRITINSGATLTITEGSLTASKVDNSGTIKIDGGTAETPVIITEDGGTDSGIGQVVLTSGSVLKDDATGSGNKKYTITGADDHTSKLILNSNHNWGMPSDARLRNLTVEITGADFWIEHTAQIDSTVDIVTDKIIHFQNNNFTLGTLSGSGNHARNGQNTVTLTMTSNSTYTGTSSIPFVLAGTHGLTLNDGNTTSIDCEAKIGNTYYATLAAAKNVTVEGEKVVTLVKDLSNTTEDAAAGMTLVIPEGITLTTTKRLGGWSNNNGAKLVVKGTLTVNGSHMPIENKSSIEIHGGATINGTPDNEGAISIVTGANVSLVMKGGESIEIAAPICIRSNVTINTPAETEISIAKLIKPWWENSGGVVTKTGAGALTIGEGGIEDYVSISLSEGTINGDEGLASKITTSVSHNVVNFDNGVYSLGPDSHNIVVKSDIEHVKAEYTITHAGETSERKSVVDGAVSVVHGDKIDIYFVAEEGYEITSGETHIWYTGVKADVTSPHNPNPAIVVSPIAPTAPTATVDTITAEGIEAAYSFTADTVSEATATYYADWTADFEVSFNKAIAKDSVSLHGQYAVPEGAQVGYTGEWIGFTLGALEANETIKLVALATGSDFAVSYEYLKQIGTFNCGVTNLSKDNEGTVMTVKLVLWKDGEEPITIGNAITYTLKAPAAPADWSDVEDVTTVLPEGTTTTVTTDDLVKWATDNEVEFAVGITIPVNALILNCAPDAVILNDVKAAADEILEDYLEEATKEVDLATLLKEIPEGGKEISIEGYPMATIKLVPATLGEGVTTSANLFKLELELK